MVHTEGTTSCHQVDAHVALAEPLEEVEITVEQKEEHPVMPEHGLVKSRPLFF
jgi:hypothetical protein